ncbi:MAG: phosphoribosylamine--glycine ligase [archaeon]|nr:phosphoribosylamine--glycine ligase [archaeon]
MKVLTVGGGGREHAAVEALYKCGAEIYSVMKNTNPGIIRRSRGYKIIDEKDVRAICAYSREIGADIAYIGPEAPLDVGLSDSLEEIGVLCAAPTKEAAKIETSKLFMRELVDKYKIAGNINYTSFRNVKDAVKYVKDVDYEVVVKPVGLTGGKGVKIQGEHLHSVDDAVRYVNEIFSTSIGKYGIIIEEKVIGEEFTQMAFCDGKRIEPMPLVQDHKRAYENDTGPNTGGMGSYSDSNHLLPFVNEKDRDAALDIIRDVVNAMNKDCREYRGPIYGQFMLTSEGPRIIEFNARFGDPEAMNVLPILESDFADICYRMATGTLTQSVKFEKKASVCKYVVPEGYGIKPISEKEIFVDEEGIRSVNANVYYANVNQKDGKLLTGTSRSLGIVGIADTIDEAEESCENALKFVRGNHIFVRHDIGKKELIQKRIKHLQKLRLVQNEKSGN